MSAEELYSIKMRASKKENGTDVHISGAEKTVEAPDVDIFANALIERGMHHSKGEADALNLKINKVCKENIIYLDALSVETIEVETWEKGKEEIKKYLKENNLKNIIGVYTHLSVADEDSEENRVYTINQIKKFNNFSRIDTIKYRHILNSGGILSYSGMDNGNYVRVGIVMYGICGENWIEGFKPVISFKSKILFIKTLIEDMDISYSRACTLKKGEVVATIDAGYADGFKRGALNKINVNIQVIKCLVVGKVCMDMLMVKIPEDMVDSVKIGDEVILYGDDLVEKAKLIGSSTYEILTGINPRVKRVYIEE